MFPFLLKQHLQDTREDAELDWVSLPKEDIVRIQEDPNPPMYACQVRNPLVHASSQSICTAAVYFLFF